MFDATTTAAITSAFYFITFYFLLLSRVSVLFILSGKHNVLWKDDCRYAIEITFYILTIIRFEYIFCSI